MTLFWTGSAWSSQPKDGLAQAAPSAGVVAPDGWMSGLADINATFSYRQVEATLYLRAERGAAAIGTEVGVLVDPLAVTVVFPPILAPEELVGATTDALPRTGELRPGEEIRVYVGRYAQAELALVSDGQQADQFGGTSGALSRIKLHECPAEE